MSNLDVGLVGGGVELPSKSIFDVVPKEGVFLGLDISKNSTGVTLIQNGVLDDGNITLTDLVGAHREVLLRRELKDKLSTVLTGMCFDLIVIEDAFQGENPTVTRLLYALNTAIDELILDGVCTCKDFVRVNNQTWKKRLYTLDKNGDYKGYNDKVRIEYCLSLLGHKSDNLAGFQDRLDSLGLIVSHFLKDSNSHSENVLNKVTGRKVKFSDIGFSFEYFEEDLFYSKDSEIFDKGYIIPIRTRVFNKKKVQKLLSLNPEAIYVTEKPVSLGSFVEDIKCDPMIQEGYLAFWVNKNIDQYLVFEEGENRHEGV